MPNKPIAVVVIGCACAIAGAAYLLIGLGVIRSDELRPGSGEALLVACAGLAFLCAGPSAMLTLLQGRLARLAAAVLTLVLVLCMATIGGWIAINAEPGSISGPLDWISPKLNDATGRVAFGLGSVICIATAALILTSLLRPKSGAGADDAAP